MCAALTCLADNSRHASAWANCLYTTCPHSFGGIVPPAAQQDVGMIPAEDALGQLAVLALLPLVVGEDPADQGDAQADEG
ncbi:MAG: hypothetical protein R3E35_01320 [Rhodocyclaceae bacterium]